MTVTSSESGPPGSFQVRTADGPTWLLPAEGYCLPHEHVICDLRVWWDGPGSGSPMPSDDPPVSVESCDAMRRRPHGVSRENMVLADWVVAAKELQQAADTGCRLVVDLTATGLDPLPALARRAAEQAGVALVVAAGHYLHDAVPDDIRAASRHQLRDRLLAQVEGGVQGCMVGILGEFGTSAEITDYERRSLQAAADAQQATGLPVNVHLHPYARRAHEVLDILQLAGGDLSRVALSHCDADIDVDWLDGLLHRGPYVEFDLFGTGPEWVIGGRGFATDAERLRAVAQLCERGFSSRLLLSHDICTRNALRRFGGWGYAHLARVVFPQLDELLGAELRQQITARNPLCLLSVGRT